MRWNVQPSGQLCPVASGSVVSAHRFRSNDAKCPLPRQSCQAMPSEVKWSPPLPYADGFITLSGGSNTSAVHDAGGLSPISIRTSLLSALPFPEHQTVPSAGFTAGE